jgi:hypothetical protein
MVWGVKQNDAHDYDQRYTGSLLGANLRRMNKVGCNEWFYDKAPARYPGRDVVRDSYREIKAHYDQGMNGVSYVGVHPPNANLEAIVRLLKQHGVWNAPVTKRTTEERATVHVKLSTLLDLNGWQIKERYFEPQFRARRQRVDVLIDCDFTDALLPIIPPQNYSGERY